ncbi:MAG: hypothetical protein R3251_00675 [Candidatus Spechtbacterales bacterium]|nr:hypothetical protein [Candidatus Spechtbacterales bacterium]
MMTDVVNITPELNNWFPVLLLFLTLFFGTLAAIVSIWLAIKTYRETKTANTKNVCIRVNNKNLYTDPFEQDLVTRYVVVQFLESDNSYKRTKAFRLFTDKDTHKDIVIGRTYDATIHRKSCGWHITELKALS